MSDRLKQLITGKNNEGIPCRRPKVECGLGETAITKYGAVFYGGQCDVCNKFKQGNFIGNFPMTFYDNEGNREETIVDPALEKAIVSGLKIKDF